MNKKLVNMAVGSILAAAPVYSAMADVKIYGSMQAEYNVEDINGRSAEQGVDDRFHSRLGFKATEKLGNGMVAIALLEFGVDTVGDTQGIGLNRQSFVGLKHKKWGFLGLGQFHSPYKLAGGPKLDPFYDTTLQAAGAGGMTSAIGSQGDLALNNRNILGHDGFVESSIMYKSPTWNNMWLSFLISPDEKPGEGGAALNGSVDDGDDNDYAVAMHYKNGPIWAFAAYGSNSIDSGTSLNAQETNEDAWKLGFQMSMGAHRLSFQYEWVDNSASLNTSGASNMNGFTEASTIEDNGASVDGEVWFLGYKFKAGNNDFIFQLGETDSDNGGAQSEYFALGMIHHFSKKTMMFAGYSESDLGGDRATGDADADNDREVWTIGLRKGF
jgi:predicted porin